MILLQNVLEVNPRLISHTFPASRAAEAFELLDRGDGEVMQVVLDLANP